MDKSSQKGTDWGLLLRVLKIAIPFKGLMMWSIFLAIILAPLSISQPFIVQKIVDQHIIPNVQEGMFGWVWIYILLLTLSVLLRYVFTYISADLGQSVIKSMRTKVYRHITDLKLRYFDGTPVGTATTRTINDIEAINNVFSQGVITIVADIITVIAVIGVMIYTSWRLTLIVMITMPFMIIASYIFKEKVRVSYQKVRQKIAEMNAFLQERISGMKIVQIFNAQYREATKFKEINRAYTSANLDSVFYYSVFFPVVELVSAIALALMIWLGAQGYLQDKVSFGALVAFPLYLNMLFRPIRFMADKFNTMQMGLVAAERVFKILDSQEFIANTGTIKPQKLNGKVTFNNVYFSYDGEKEILKDISFSVHPGEKLALVGSTGAGKSTIINILNRFYEIKSGKICIDDIDITDYELYALRNRIAIVLQDVFLFEGTITENISLRDSTMSFDKIKSAAVSIGADEFIMHLPQGYDFKVSERGSNLSAGQRQLISFVRALVADPDILILDEATSSIDTESELIIQKAINTLINNRTSIIIAHRLSTIKSADTIIVMDQGTIVESGSHDSLLQLANGRYKELYEIQYVPMLPT